MTVQRARISGVVLLRSEDGAALLQHRDDKPGLAHAGFWVPPGGHCGTTESATTCAVREFFEETNYRCTSLRHLRDLDVDDVPYAPPIRLSMYWDVYDGRQTIVCNEGQALEFVGRAAVNQIVMPTYLLGLWDEALEAWRAEGGGP